MGVIKDYPDLVATFVSGKAQFRDMGSKRAKEWLQAQSEEKLPFGLLDTDPDTATILVAKARREGLKVMVRDRS